MKRQIVTIDTSKWITQKKYCELTGTPMSNMSYLITSGKVKSRYIPHLKLTLVEKPVIKSPL